MLLNEAFHKVSKDVLQDPTINKDVNSALLSLHESTTKLWQAIANNQKDKVSSRAASILISAFYVMHELGIDNPEDCLIRKLEELNKEHNKQG